MLNWTSYDTQLLPQSTAMTKYSSCIADDAARNCDELCAGGNPEDSPVTDCDPSIIATFVIVIIL